MLWAPFPVRTYWLPHTRPAPKWIVHNSFNRSPPETTGKRPFLSETSSMPANSKPRELQGLPAAAPPPQLPPPPARQWVPAARVPAHTLYCADRGPGGLPSLTPQPAPRLEKQPTRSDTDNSPRFQASSKNREAGPGCVWSECAFRSPQSCQNSRTWGLLPRLTFVFRGPPPAASSGRGGKMEKEPFSSNTGGLVLHSCFLNIKEWEEIVAKRLTFAESNLAVFQEPWKCPWNANLEILCLGNLKRESHLGRNFQSQAPGAKPWGLNPGSALYWQVALDKIPLCTHLLISQIQVTLVPRHWALVTLRSVKQHNPFRKRPRKLCQCWLLSYVTPAIDRS